jgi:hypothetical protein
MRIWQFGGLLALLASSARTSVPASVEEILCSTDTLIEVVVTDARSHDCGTNMCTARVGVSGRIERVLQPSPGILNVGDTMSAIFNVNDKKPMRIGNEWRPINTSDRSALGWPETEGAITDKAAKEQLLGRHLFLAVNPVEKFKADGPKAFGEGYYAAVYEPTEEAWLLKTWASCRRSERG